jgi:hypothetical protein
MLMYSISSMTLALSNVNDSCSYIPVRMSRNVKKVWNEDEGMTARFMGLDKKTFYRFLN